MPTQEEIMQQAPIPGQENGVAAIESLLEEGETEVKEAVQPKGVASIESLLEVQEAPVPVPEPDGGFLQDTGVGRGLVAGTKEFLGSAGLALEESSLKVNDAFRWMNDKVIKSDAFNQWIDEQDKRIEENISDVQEYKADVPEMQGGVGEFFGQLIPQTALFATAIMTRNPMLADAAVGTMGLSSVGSGLDTYEQYKLSKGEEVDELEKWGAGLAYGLAEFIPERIGLGFLMPKGVATKAAGKLMGRNIDQVAKTGKEMIEDLIKANPTKTRNLLGNLAKASSVEAAQESVTELMNMATDRYLTGMDISAEEFGKRLATSAAGGAAMGGMLGPFSHFSQRAVDKSRREALGSVTLAQDEAGQTWELVDTKDGLVGFSPSGKVNKNMDPALKEKAITVPLDAFNRMVEGAREAGGFSDELFREEQHRALRQHVARQLNTYGHTDGQLHVWTDPQDVDEATGQPREYFVINEEEGMAIMMDRDGNRRIESAKDIAPKVEVYNEQQVFDQVKQRFDEANPLEPVTADSEPDTFTMQGKEYKVTDVTPEGLWIAAEIDETGSTTGEVIQLTPEQQEAVTQELIGSPETKPDVRVIDVAGQQYKLVPTEDGNNIIDGVFSQEEAAAAAQNIEGVLGEKLNVEVIRQDSGDAYTPDTYTVKLSERGEVKEQKPTYRVAGQDVTREDAMAYVAAAETAEDVADLEVEGDEEIATVIGERFKPEYRFKGVPVSKMMAQAMINAGRTEDLEVINDAELEAAIKGPEIKEEEGPQVEQDFAAEEVTRLTTIAKEAEDGATMNLDGTKYEEGGLAVPVDSKNTTQAELSREMIDEFVEANKDKIPENSTVKVGLYKFPDSDQVSIDLNIVVPEQHRDVALKFGELAGQESLYDLTTGENVKTGADGKNPRSFNAAELNEIALSLAEGKLPKAVEATTKKQAEPTNTKNDAALTQDFFSDVVTGKSDKYKPSKPWKPLLTFNRAQNAFKKVFDRFKGNFDDHIATSIPGFRDTQIKVGNAISSMLYDEGGLVYDLGGSEGGFVKAITEDTDGRVKSINLDPNPDMQKVHEATPVEGSEFVPEAFYEGFDDFKAHKPTEKADVVHESMMFQFITDERAAYIKEVADNYLKDDGLFITEEKFKLTDAEQQKANEAKKNKDYKTRFYTEQQINEKAEEVLVGMHKDQANYDSYKEELGKYFDYVSEYWDGGNFKGLVATNSKEKHDQFLKEVGDTQTEFSESQIKKDDQKDEVRVPGGERRGQTTEQRGPEREASKRQADTGRNVQDLGQAEKAVETEPTEAQKEAGNYKKGHTRVQGFEITIENPKGSTRRGKDQAGKAWATKMNNTYGYFKRTKGKDGDQIDVFLGPNPENGKIFVVDQIDPTTGKFDEHKVMMGFESRDEAIKAYKSNYSKGWQGMGPVVEVGKDAFTKWLNVEQTNKRNKRMPISFMGINKVKYPTNPANTTRQQFAEQAQAAIKRALSSVAPDTEVLLAGTREEFAKAIEGIKGANQNDKGVLLTRNGKHTILINVPRMSTTTAAHELSHVVFAELVQASPLHFNQFKEDVAKALEGRVRQELEDFVSGYDKVDRGEEFFAELTAMMADGKMPRSAVQSVKEVVNKWFKRIFGFEPFGKAAKAKDILDFFQNVADQIREGEVITEATIDLRKLGLEAKSNLKEFNNNGGSRELTDPIEIKFSKGSRDVTVGDHDLSFVQKSDLIDIDSLIKDISDKGQKVWFWVADQLGRGYYNDEVIGKEHFMDAGPSYALDPKHRSKNILWASGMPEPRMAKSIEASDYLFVISGSPIRSKMFNKQVFNLLKERVGKFDSFKKGVLRSEPTKPLREAISPFKSWDEILNSPKRKDLLVAIYETSQKKTDTPAKKYLKRRNAIIDPNELRDGFYRDNGFEQNDLMLVLKPTKVGGKSDHSTYERDVLGEVVGVPDKIVNAFDLMPDEMQSKLKEGAAETQKSQVIAPYGSGVREVVSPAEQIQGMVKRQADWFSPTRRALDKISQKKGTPEQFKSMLVKQGAKPVEMEWMGFDDAFKGKKSITKEEVRQWLDANEVQIEETTKRSVSEDEIDALLEDEMGEGMTREDAREYLEGEEGATRYEDYQLPGGENYQELLLTMPGRRATLNAEYNRVMDERDALPIGSEERAALNWKLELINNDIQTDKDTYASSHWDEGNILAHIRFNERSARPKAVEGRDAKLAALKFDDFLELRDQGNGFYKVYNKMKDTEYAAGYSKEKMKEANLTERDLKDYLMRPDGDLITVHPNYGEASRKYERPEQVLFLEEVQSDWAQEGRREGFIDKAKEANYKEFEKDRDEYNRIKKEMEDHRDRFDLYDEVKLLEEAGYAYGTNYDKDHKTYLYKQGADKWRLTEKANLEELSPELKEAHDKVLAFHEVTNKMDDRRRALVEKHSEKLSEWNNEPYLAYTGEYSEGLVPDMPYKKTDQWVNLALRRMIRHAAENGYDRIAWTTGEQQAERYDLSKQVDEVEVWTNNDGTYQVDVNKDGLQVAGWPSMTEKELEANFGKELASKIVEDKPEHKKYAGQDLSVGGEGMKSFYDKMMPKAANKLGKKYGAKVEMVDLPEIGEQWSIPVTEKMKEAAMSEGTAKFQKTAKPDEKQLQGFGNKVRNVFQDSMLAVRNWQESLEKEGIKIRDFENAYMKENLSHGRILDKMDRFTDKQGKQLINKVSAFVKAGNLTMDDARNYVVAKHGPERNRWFWSQEDGNRGQDFSGLTELKERVVAATTDAAEAMLLEAMPVNDFADYYAKTIEDKVGEKQTAALKKAVNDATDFSLKEMRDSGFLSKEQYDNLKQRYDYYVPLRGWSETLDSDGESWDYASQFGKASSPMKRAKGRKSLADDPFAFILNMANTAVIAAERNKIAQATGNLVRNNRKAMEKYAEFKPVYFVKTDDMNEAGEPIIYETIDRPEQKLWDEGRVTTKVPTDYKKRKTQAQSKEHEVDFYENGQKMVLVMKNPEISRALMGIKGTDWTTNWNSAVNSPLLKIGDKTVIGAPGAATRYLSQVMTSMNPAFVLPNMARDIPLAMLSEFVHGSTKDAMTMVPNLRKAEGAIRRRLAGKAPKGRIDQLYDEFLKSGAATGFIHQKDVDHYRKELERGLRDANRTMNPITMASKGMRAGIDAVEKLSEWSENITRFAVYLNHRNKGASAEQAATEAKNSSVNFNRKGRLSPAINGLFAFFNAGVQAGDKYFKMWGANWKKMAAAHSFLAVQGFLSAMMMDLFGGDDEEGTRNYDKLSSFTRHNYLNVPVPGSEKVVTIPMPHVLRAFHGMGVSAYDMMTERITTEEAIKETIGSIPTDIIPVDGAGLFDRDGNLSLKPFMPTAVKPLFELGMNENFMGYRISPEPYTPKQKDMIADTKTARKNANSAAQAITDLLYEMGGGDETGYRYVEKDGELKKIPSMLDLSPHTLEHLVNSYLGGTGKFVGNVYKTTEGVAKTGLRMAQGDDFKKAIEEIQLNSTPVVRRFVRTPSGDPLMGSYYDTKNEIDRWSQLIKFYENDMSIEGVNKYIDLWTKVGMPIETFKLQYDVIDKINDSVIAMQNAGDEAGMDALEKEKRAAMKEAVKSWEEK